MGNTVSAAHSTATSLTSLAVGSSSSRVMLDASELPQSHPASEEQSLGSPPAQCPMHHQISEFDLKLPPNHTTSFQTPTSSVPPAECPMHNKVSEAPRECPVDHSKFNKAEVPSGKAHHVPPGTVIPSECPMHQSNQEQAQQVKYAV